METKQNLIEALRLNGITAKPRQLSTLLKALKADGQRRENFCFACVAMGLVGGTRTYKTIRQLEKDN